MSTNMRLKFFYLIGTFCISCITAFSQDCVVVGGNISFDKQDTVYTICAGNASPDLLYVEIDSTVEGALSYYIISDTAGIILNVLDSFPYDFDDAGTGICYIHHLSAADSITSPEASQSIDSLRGCFALSNSLRVIKLSGDVNGGIISTNSPTTICLGDGSTDSIDFSIENNAGELFSWAVTDTSGNILGLSTGSRIEIESDGPDHILIWNISYLSGLTGLEIGENVIDLQGCFAFSNAIEVIKVAPNGGELFSLAGSETLSICGDEGMIDSLFLSLEGNIGERNAWLITDTGNIIIALPEVAPFDLNGLDSSTLKIWHLSYNDTISGLEIGADAADLQGCYDLSDAVTINFSSPVVGGFIATQDSLEELELCAGDTHGEALDLSITAGSGTFSNWLITDSVATILSVIPSLPLDFSQLPSGELLVWNLSYEAGLKGLDVGNNATELEGCFGLSNFIRIIRKELESGAITTRDSLTELTFCPGDEVGQSVDAQLSRGSGENGQWLITGMNGIITRLPEGPPFDFSENAQGTYHIWYLNFNDSIIGLEEGGSVDSLLGCYVFSNSITINVGGVDGGRIFLPGNSTTAMICLDDKLTELKFASSVGATGSNSQWLITNEAGYIEDLPDGPPFSFERSKPGTSYIWHLSYENEVSGLELGINTTSLEGCFGLSNAIAIIRAEVEAGTITTRDTGTNVTICPLTEEFNDVDLILDEGSGENEAWVITDTAGIILDLPEGPPFNFDHAGSGLSLIWHLTYTGDLEGLDPGNHIDNLRGCFAFSNPIEVNHSGGALGGVIKTVNNSDQIIICVENNYSDPVDVRLSGDVGDHSAWIVTNQGGQILKLPGLPPFRFEGDDPADNYLWHISYMGNISGLEIGNFIEDLQGCFAISNSIQILKKVNGCQSGNLIEFGHLDNVGSSWKKVTLQHSYKSMVVVATPQISSIWTKPVVTRIRNAAGNSFEIKVQNPGDEAISASYGVQYIVAEEGVYRAELDGINMEARKIESVRTSKKRRSQLEPRDYLNSYNTPVVLGQVMSFNDERWSVFWSSEERRKIFTPNSFSLSATKHIGEDASSERADEVIGMIIMEAGYYELAGVKWEVNITPKAIRGVHDTNLGIQQESQLDSIYGGVLSSYGMRGSNYGWPVFFGEAPFAGKYFKLAFDEDQIRDQERRHPNEEVAYVVFGESSSSFLPATESESIALMAPPAETLNALTSQSGDLQIRPNPIQDDFILDVMMSTKTEAQIEIINMQGAKLFDKAVSLSKGSNTYSIANLNLTDGLYALTVVTANGLKLQKKFVILR